MTKKRILLYYPPNKRSIAIETLCRAVVEAGHELIVLTLTPRGDFHQKMEEIGATTYTTIVDRKPSWKYFLVQTRRLIRFCNRHKIDMVWSHLQESNVIAVLAQQFIPAKVVAFRHHAESAFYAEYGDQFGMERNKNEIRFDKVINRLAKTIVIPSSGVWYGMEKYEGANMKKVVLAPYIYDFSTYDKPDPAKVKMIRETHSCKLLLIMVSRFVASKQHQPVFEVLNDLVKEGLDIKMIVMDDGPLRPMIEEYTKTNKLENVVDFVGFKKDFINYMAAADLLMHPSLTEASSNVAKEMGLLEKTIAVCKDVGDFNDYICDRENGYLMKRENLKEEIEKAVRLAYEHPDELTKMGQHLKKDVLKLFNDTPENRKRFLALIEKNNKPVQQSA
ncbi:MAG TPA: glycosyltransferase family 4 protein [Chitinophagaceae bacterium]|nr:glycosyltransferase family 4 protein [Chitinophagaceae bacterium]